MQWPDTNAVQAGAAGLAASSDSQRAVQASGLPASGLPASGLPASGLRPAPQQGVSVPGQVKLSRVAGRLDLPCREDPELFFAESPADVECAKALCRGCPVMIACFTGAVERREPWGVWGGELFLRGQVVPRKRPRGRPRKDEVAA
jgi:WhiB family redox-sensing transcriptional regulator